jgi:hypothetical protein
MAEEQQRSSEGNEREHKLKSSTGISYSADPVLRVEQSIRSEIAAVSPFVDELMFFIKTSRCVPGREIDVEVCLREALANAVVHGNHEDPQKHAAPSAMTKCRMTPSAAVHRPPPYEFTPRTPLRKATVSWITHEFDVVCDGIRDHPCTLLRTIGPTQFSRVFQEGRYAILSRPH